MSILKYKYKAHKFINYAFYIVVFIFGFLLGFTTQKLDFNKLISQVLMIDNVSAYTIYEDENISFDDDFARKKLIEHYGDEIDFNIYKYFIFTKTDNYISFELFNDTIINNLYINQPFSYGNHYLLGINSSFRTYTLVYYMNTETFEYHINTLDEPIESFMMIYIDDSSGIQNRTNFDFPFFSDEVNDIFNPPNLQFNENLFKDNSDFKEVCVDKGKKYSITTTNIDIVSNSIFVSDFIWFPGKVTGVKYSEYDSLEDDNILVFNDDVSTENYYFKDKEKIDLLYNDEIISNYFIHSGYTDKYSLYGYTAYKFIHSYYVDDDNNSQNMFTIFDFTDMNFSPFGSAGGSSGSFGDTPLTYCFYVKNEFNVTELQTNEWNDYVGIVPTPGGYLDVITSHNKNNSSNKVESFFSIINNLIAELKPTINFIKEHIEQLYLSMPLIVRNFILSFLVLIVIRILIGMVVK